MPKDTRRTSESPRTVREGNKDPNNANSSPVQQGMTEPRKTDWIEPDYNDRDASGWPKPA